MDGCTMISKRSFTYMTSGRRDGAGDLNSFGTKDGNKLRTSRSMHRYLDPAYIPCRTAKICGAIPKI